MKEGEKDKGESVLLGIAKFSKLYYKILLVCLSISCLVLCATYLPYYNAKFLEETEVPLLQMLIWVLSQPLFLHSSFCAVLRNVSLGVSQS